MKQFSRQIAVVLSLSAMSVTICASALAQGASDGGRGKSRFSKATSYLAASKLQGGFKPEMIVIHKLEGSLAATESFMKMDRASVSCHYLVGKDGEVVQMVSEKNGAFHAKGINRNSYCVGFEGFAGESLTDEQIAKGREIVQGLERDKQISKVVTHQEVRTHLDCTVADQDLKSILTTE